LLRILGRASIIVFILSGVIFASALTMGKPNQIQLHVKWTHAHYACFCTSSSIIIHRNSKF
jgi:hypothetical protein